MPARLREPSRLAACEPQKSRCSLPGERDCPHMPGHDIEIERTGSVDVLNIVDDPHRRHDAEAIEGRLVGKKDALVVRAVAEKFDGQRLALGVDAPTVLQFPSGLAKQSVGLAQIVANGLGRVADRIRIGLGEDLCGDLVADRFEDRQFLAPRAGPRTRVQGHGNSWRRARTGRRRSSCGCPRRERRG